MGILGGKFAEKTDTFIRYYIYKDNVALKSIYVNSQVSSSLYVIIFCRKIAVKTEKWSKMLFLQHFCGLKLYYLMTSWPGYWQRCVSMPFHHCLMDFWLVGQFLEQIYPTNGKKRHFNGKLRPFTASICVLISALYFET